MFDVQNIKIQATVGVKGNGPILEGETTVASRDEFAL
jgi:hypothetical protein